MSGINTTWALSELDKLISQMVMRNASGDGYITTQNQTAAPDGEVTRQAQIVEQIFDRVIPGWRQQYNETRHNRWDGDQFVRSDVTVGKNYLSQDELSDLRLGNAFLDLAEGLARRKIPMTMEDWAKRLDGYLELSTRGKLEGAGSVTRHRPTKLHRRVRKISGRPGPALHQRFRPLRRADA